VKTPGWLDSLTFAVAYIYLGDFRTVCSECLISEEGEDIADIMDSATGSRNYLAVSSPENDIALYYADCINGETEQSCSTKHQPPRPFIVLEGHEEYIVSITFHPYNNAILASGSDDYTVRVWDIASGTGPIMVLHLDDGVSLVEFNAAGDKLLSVATGYLNETVQVWSMQSYEVCWKFTVSGDAMTHWRGSCILHYGIEGTLKTFDMDSQTQTKSIPLQTGASERMVRSLTFSERADILAIAFQDAIEIWDANYSSLISTIDSMSKTYVSLKLSMDGAHLAALFNWNGSKAFAIYETANGTAKFAPVTLRQQKSFIRISSVCFGPQCNQFACCVNEDYSRYRIRVFDLHSGKQLFELERGGSCIAYSNAQVILL
jgi:WD40 repeat protein